MERENDQPNTSIVPLGGDDLIRIAEQAEKRSLAVVKIKQMALKVTNEDDWVDQSGKPYLQASGAEKVARLFGISWRFMGDPRKITEDDGYVRYEVPMEFIMGNLAIEVIGTRSGKDVFFTTRYEWNEETKKRDKKVVLPPSEIDNGDVLKSAITNGIANGISRLLGIRNLSYEDLAKAGLSREKIGKVEYKKSEGKGGQEPGKTGFISEPQRKRLYAIYSKLNYSTDLIKKWLLLEYQIDSSEKIPSSKYEVICTKIEKSTPEEMAEYVATIEEDNPSQGEGGNQP